MSYLADKVLPQTEKAGDSGEGGHPYAWKPGWEEPEQQLMGEALWPQKDLLSHSSKTLTYKPQSQGPSCLVVPTLCFWLQPTRQATGDLIGEGQLQTTLGKNRPEQLYSVQVPS